MSKDIKIFCSKYKEKLKNDEDIKTNTDISPFFDFRERISFYLSYRKYIPASFEINIIGYNNDTSLFELDSEDLEYFYKKYSKKLNQELEKNIEKLKDEYKDI
jgi:tRNA G46 methylase TrmB